ncbi:Eco57I restriction-modification methylase domain-containing protein [Mycobacterium paragordonae]|uniref:Eco57I restriction-modification methylase domain-containing protein n=1 Tax=Mycobacterium paragordonae TaxID=1389713 RepID=UPI00140B3B28|nr:N-6 DNA methylase [Mycobacterium paragordonae]
MTEVSLVHTSGGLIGDVITDNLRQPDVEGDAKFLTEVSTFTDLDGAAPTKAQLASDQEAAFRTGVALWSAYADELAQGMDISRIRERLVLKLLNLLGFQPQYQRSKLHAGDQTWDISHLGWHGQDAPPVHTVAAEDLDSREGGHRSPHEELQGFLNASPMRWGILTNGRVARLLRDYHHIRARGYVEFDLASIFEAGSWPDFLALWRLCHVSRFQLRATEAVPLTDAAYEEEGSDDGADASAVAVDTGVDTLLEELYVKAISAGVAAGRRLQPQVRAAISRLANGLMDANPDLRTQLEDDPDVGRDLYRELLTVLYRILFLLFAEQRGMLQDAHPLYKDSYSLTRLRTIATERSTEPRRMDLWEGLKVTFRLFSNEGDAAVLGVYPYNGFLFDQTRTPLTSNSCIANIHLAGAIESLTTVQTGKVSLHIDYRNLGVEELGAVYESLLDYTLTIATDAQYIDGSVVHPGEAYLAPLSIDRADLASYYTPVELTELLLSRTLDPLIEQTLITAGDDAAAQVDALLDLKVVDPACGSAAILVGALDRIAYAVAKARSAPHEPRDAELAHARREVLQRCIYGAEKDPFAVELAKVALWIHCVVPDQPLTFLDHHIVCGDSLVGWPLLNVPNTIPDDAYKVTSAKGAERSTLTKALGRNQAFNAAGGDLFQQGPVEFTLTLPAELRGPERTPEDVRRKAAAYRDWMDSPGYARWKQTADLWTAAFFWTNPEASGAAPTSAEYAAALDGHADPEFVSAAADLLADINPLHWPLAFPEAHANGGFDLVLGNPPWEQFESGEQPFFKQHKPTIAAMTSETRKKAIAALQADEPATFNRWKQYQALQGRMAHYAKACGRYTRTSGKVNTYVLFTELAAHSSRHVGLIVKSGIAVEASQSPVWKKMLDGDRVREVIDMINQEPSGKRVFPAVAAVERFSILHLGVPSSGVFDASMLNLGVSDATIGRLRKWTKQDLRTVAPRTFSLLSTNDRNEIDLALELQDRFDTLDFADEDGANPWGLKFATLFNSSGAKESGQLLRGPTLEEQGFKLGRDKRYLHRDGRIAVPVYEGQMANRWDHRARTFEGFTGRDRYGRKPHIPWVTDEQHADPDYEAEPRYWMHEKVARARLDEVVPKGSAMIAFRDIGRPWTDRRIVRGCLYPDYPATDALQMLVLNQERTLAFLALFNSMTFDFLTRIHMPGGNLSLWIPSQCATPSPREVPEAATKAAAELSLTSTSVAQAVGQPVSKWDPTRRELLDASCDALVAKAYGLTTAEYEIVLNHFKLLERIETRQPHGEYRSKRLRLEAFEEIGGGR